MYVVLCLFLADNINSVTEAFNSSSQREQQESSTCCNLL